MKADKRLSINIRLSLLKIFSEGFFFVYIEDKMRNIEGDAKKIREWKERAGVKIEIEKEDFLDALKGCNIDYLIVSPEVMALLSEEYSSYITEIEEMSLLYMKTTKMFNNFFVLYTNLFYAAGDVYTENVYIKIKNLRTFSIRELM